MKLTLMFGSPIIELAVRSINGGRYVVQVGRVCAHDSARPLKRAALPVPSVQLFIRAELAQPDPRPILREAAESRGHSTGQITTDGRAAVSDKTAVLSKRNAPIPIHGA